MLEPFITPALYEKYATAVDEWTLSTAMAADTGPGGGIGQLEDHYKTFIVRPARPSAEHRTHVFRRRRKILRKLQALDSTGSVYQSHSGP